ncbi:MAG: hypothetical protein ACU843_13070 [Gammaproteobacteria bacterium]
MATTIVGGADIEVDLSHFDRVLVLGPDTNVGSYSQIWCIASFY